MQTHKNIPYYITALCIFGILKLGYTKAGNAHLDFLLHPTDRVVGLLTGTNSRLTESGYLHESLNILIDKSCSGFNFWILCFLLFTYLGLKYFSTTFHKILIIPAALLVAYLLTIFANSSRIFVSIIMQHQTKNIFPSHQHLVHEAIGIISNLSFLILAYWLLEKFLTQKQNHAKLT